MGHCLLVMSRGFLPLLLPLSFLLLLIGALARTSFSGVSLKAGRSFSVAWGQIVRTTHPKAFLPCFEYQPRFSTAVFKFGKPMLLRTGSETCCI